jgi:hypothetical protein
MEVLVVGSSGSLHRREPVLRRQWIPIVSTSSMKQPQREPDSIQQAGWAGHLVQQGREGCGIQLIIDSVTQHDRGASLVLVVGGVRRRTHDRASYT